MTRNTQPHADRAREFLGMHHEASILVLLNAWDVASARILAASGSRAIGTTSMGISASLGLPEGEVVEWDVMLARIASIAAAVDVPVTADVEHGYAPTVDHLGERVRAVVGAGVVGLNVEDSGGGPGSPLIATDAMVERVAAIRRAADATGVPLVINAKTDVFLSGGGGLEQAVSRGNAYASAGADCVFVPGGLEREEIGRLVEGLDAPLNVVANPAIGSTVPSVPELEALGVARVSVGSGLMRATLALTRRAAEEVLSHGTYSVFAQELAAAGDSYRMAISEA